MGLLSRVATLQEAEQSPPAAQGSESRRPVIAGGPQHPEQPAGSPGDAEAPECRPAGGTGGRQHPEQPAGSLGDAEAPECRPAGGTGGRQHSRPAPGSPRDAEAPGARPAGNSGGLQVSQPAVASSRGADGHVSGPAGVARGLQVSQPAAGSPRGAGAPVARPAGMAGEDRGLATCRQSAAGGVGSRRAGAGAAGIGSGTGPDSAGQQAGPCGLRLPRGGRNRGRAGEAGARPTGSASHSASSRDPRHSAAARCELRRVGRRHRHLRVRARRHCAARSGGWRRAAGESETG